MRISSLDEYYVVRIKGYCEVVRNLPGSFVWGRDIVITSKPVASHVAYAMSRKLNNTNQTLREQLATA